MTSREREWPDREPETAAEAVADLGWQLDTLWAEFLRAGARQFARLRLRNTAAKWEALATRLDCLVFRERMAAAVEADMRQRAGERAAQALVGGFDRATVEANVDDAAHVLGHRR